ncbi:hypothetical protein, partial [Klebsiella pneumoniae]|uniref:hypothetical protein n=1 Tax=Klebsiella pneumoniae TaxID=573 RepID=UPI001C8C2332
MPLSSSSMLFTSAPVMQPSSYAPKALIHFVLCPIQWALNEGPRHLLRLTLSHHFLIFHQMPIQRSHHHGDCVCSVILSQATTVVRDAG